MTPLKDTLEAATPVAETALAQASERKADAGGLRADAVSLDVPVKVHGSRIKEVVREITPHTEPFEEQTATLIVFPQGGVVRMSTPVTAGQMVVLTNLKSGHDAICRVVKVRACPPSQSYVEVEFTHRQPGYWGVHFASDAPPMSQQTVPPPTPVASYVAPQVSVALKIEKAEEKKAVPSVSWAPRAQTTPAASHHANKLASLLTSSSAPVEPITEPLKPGSPFVSIGAQEDVQPAASSTTGRQADPFAGSERLRGVGETPKKPAADFRQAPQAGSDSSFSMSELRGDMYVGPSLSFPGTGMSGEVVEEPKAGANATVESSSNTFGRSAVTVTVGGLPAAHQESFGSGLTSATLGTDEYGVPLHASKSKGPKWVLIAAGAAAFCLLVAGSAFYFKIVPFASNSGKSSAAISAVLPAATVFDTGAGQYRTAGPVGQGNPARAVAVTPSATALASLAPLARVLKSASSAESQPSAAARQKSPAPVPGMFVGLNAHPVSSQRAEGSGDTDSAPSLDAGPPSDAENNGLQEIGASSAPVPQPAAPAPNPVRIGGQIKPPRLVFSALPIYPNVAMQAEVEGDVVVDASIDKTGQVVAAKVISGPLMLRQAAIDAVRKWKYEPSLLNGVPIAIQTRVTIRFHR
jgi:TonB family protein